MERKDVIVTIICECAVEVTDQEIRFTLMDALAEFQSARHHNGQSYVDKRYSYPGNPYANPESRNKKIAQVNRRIALAEDMRNGIDSIIVSSSVDEDDTE